MLLGRTQALSLPKKRTTVRYAFGGKAFGQFLREKCVSERKGDRKMDFEKRKTDAYKKVCRECGYARSDKKETTAENIAACPSDACGGYYYRTFKSTRSLECLSK
jgi:hypothetical protein